MGKLASFSLHFLQQQTRNILALEFEMKHLQIEIKYQNAECIQRNIVLLNVMCLHDALKITENNLHVKAISVPLSGQKSTRLLQVQGSSYYSPA